jgi:general secretion pathway protein A
VKADGTPDLNETEAASTPSSDASASTQQLSPPASTQQSPPPAELRPSVESIEPSTTNTVQTAPQQPLAAATTDAEPAEKRIYLEDLKKVFGEYPEIHFELDSNTLDTEAYFLLGLLARYIRQKPETVLVLRGYTDRTGTRAYNLKLAAFRADMVKTYLVGKGVRADAISTLAIGPDPQGPGGTTVPYDGRRRKVVVEIIAPES